MSDPVEVRGSLSAEDILAHENLYSETETLGNEPPRHVREGGISFGRPIVYRLSVDEFPVLHKRTDVPSREFVLVEFPFDLDRLSAGRGYVRAEFTVELGTPDTVARSLWPARVETPHDVERARLFTVAPDGSLCGHPMPQQVFNPGRVFRYVDLHPVIMSFGSGRSMFSWTFEHDDSAALTPAGRTVFAILDLPAGTYAVTGTFTAEAIVRRKVLAAFEKIQSRTNRLPFRLDLRAEPSAKPEAPDPRRPKVFISYAHDNEEHVRKVVALAEFLVSRGIDVNLDWWANAERQDWSRWATEGITTADFVVIVASQRYRQFGDGSGPTGDHRGIQSEAATLRDLLHRNRATWVPKLIPVLLAGHEPDDLPIFVQPYTASHFRVSDLSDIGAESLLRVLTGQPAWVRPPLGRIPDLPPHSPSGV